jgi:hypothetical protein
MVGTTPVVCSTTDLAGNTTTGSFNVTVTLAQNFTHSWSGVLQPINPDGSSIFKWKSTVPVKFRLTGASAGITNLVATITYVKL